MIGRDASAGTVRCSPGLPNDAGNAFTGGRGVSGVGFGLEGLEAPGFAGKVLNGPSRTFRFVGGRPRSFPVSGFEDEGQADETAGPWRRRRGFADDGVVGVSSSVGVCGMRSGGAEGGEVFEYARQRKVVVVGVADWREWEAAVQGSVSKRSPGVEEMADAGG